MLSWIGYLVDIVFSLGLFINAMLFIPQAIMLYRKKHANDVSFATFLGFNILQFFTVIHGYLVGDYILMIGFLLSFVTCGIVTGLIFYYNKQTN